MPHIIHVIEPDYYDIVIFLIVVSVCSLFDTPFVFHFLTFPPRPVHSTGQQWCGYDALSKLHVGMCAVRRSAALLRRCRRDCVVSAPFQSQLRSPSAGATRRRMCSVVSERQEQRNGLHRIQAAATDRLATSISALVIEIRNARKSLDADKLSCRICTPTVLLPLSPPLLPSFSIHV